MTGRATRRAWLAGGVAVLLAGLIGCQEKVGATLTVKRAALLPGQVVGTWTTRAGVSVFAEGDDGTLRVLLGFPLPGSRTGAPVYYLYLRLRPGGGDYPLPGPSVEKAVFMHLARTPGELTRLAAAHAGRLTLRRDARPGCIGGEYDLTVEGGERLTGRFVAEEAPAAVSQFEATFLADQGGRRPSDAAVGTVAD